MVAALLSLLFVKYRINEPPTSINTVNLEDGLQKEELENLSEDDYRKLNSPDIYNLDLDDVDNTYYYKMVEMPGVYKENATREEREKIYLYKNDLKATVLEMCKKDGDWSLIINSDEIGRFNQKDGLLEGFKYDSIESGDWVGDDYSGYVNIVAKNDDEERQYRVSVYKEDGIIQSVIVKLGEIKSLKTNNEIDLNKLKFNKEHVEDNFNSLCKYESAYKGGLDWNKEDIGITEHFYKKYPYFLDLFIHYSPLEYNKITLKDLDAESQIVIFEVDSRLECKKRTYEVKYILDDNMYLDDVETKILKEVDYEGTSADRENKIFYKNSNWQNLKITDNFISKFAKTNSVFPDIDNVSYNFKWSSEFYNQIAKKGIGTIKSYRFKDDSINYYYYKSIYENNYLDDVICKKLPYDGLMTLEEVLDAFTADKELQKELGIEISE